MHRLTLPMLGLLVCSLGLLDALQGSWIDVEQPRFAAQQVWQASSPAPDRWAVPFDALMIGEVTEDRLGSDIGFSLISASTAPAKQPLEMEGEERPCEANRLVLPLYHLYCVLLT